MHSVHRREPGCFKGMLCHDEVGPGFTDFCFQIVGFDKPGSAFVQH